MKKEIFKGIIADSIREDFENLKNRELKLLDINKVHVISGPRRSGKTSFLFNTINQLRQLAPRENIFYVNFDDERLFPLKLEDLQWITEAYYEIYPDKKNERVYIFFDEVQEVALWEKYVRRIYDTENIRLYVTGSSSKILYSGINTSLRGRTLFYRMYPLSFPEYLEFQNISSNFYESNSRAAILEALNRYLTTGGFPEIVGQAEETIYKVLKEYLDLTVYKDIIDRYNIGNNTILKYLISICFRNTATLFSINKIFNDLKSMGLSLSKNTLYDYLHYLEDASLVFSVPVFSHSLKDQQRNPNKLYVIDNGYHSLVSPKKDVGKLFENTVFLHIKRRYAEIFYYKGKQEVDFCFQDEAGHLNLINVAYDLSDRATINREISGLNEAMKTLSVKSATLVNAEMDEIYKTPAGEIRIIPLYKWLLQSPVAVSGEIEK